MDFKSFARWLAVDRVLGDKAAERLAVVPPA
jgi:hypothetical protein